MAKLARADPKSGFDPKTRTYHSLRPEVPLPPTTKPLSLTEYALSLLSSSRIPLSSTPSFIDATTGHHVSYSILIRQIKSLSAALSPILRRGETALILSPSSLQIPVLYFSLMSLGITVAPANPLSSESEISRQIDLTRPKAIFAVKSAAKNLPNRISHSVPIFLIDSPEFLSMLEFKSEMISGEKVRQSDLAAILFSSGTTGKVKGVELTHRSLIAVIAGYEALRRSVLESEPHPVALFILPMFHVFGFFMLVRSVAFGETVVVMERFDLAASLAAVERYKVTYMPASPPLVVALTKSELTEKYDLSSLKLIGCGGAPLGEEVAERFRAKFPNVEIAQGYGLTETAGSVTRTIEAEESNNVASVGKLAENMEAKIVDPVSGQPLPPGQRGELWVRGPFVMKGYIGDEKATAETLDSKGWLKTGDLCMFDSEGFLYIVDRLKELIKYKAYQVPPAELEQLLQSHPEIADAAVIPYPDEDAGQIPMAYVVRKPGSNLSEAQVINFVAKKVAPYKKVRRVAFIDAIPKSPAGKILRRELVSHALSAIKSKL